MAAKIHNIKTIMLLYNTSNQNINIFQKFHRDIIIFRLASGKKQQIFVIFGLESKMAANIYIKKKNTLHYRISK